MTRPFLRREAVRARRLLAVLLVAGLAASACGDDQTQAADPRPGDSSADLLITADALPRGWRDSNSQGIDYRVSVCGVDIEPERPLGATSIRFSQGPLGPFLEQHVRVYDSPVVAEVVAEVREALPDCSGYTVEGGGPDRPTARFDIAPLSVRNAPQDSVAWRQTSRGRVPVTADLILVDRGDAAVMLMSYAIRSDPDPAVLERAVAALPEAE